MRIESPTLGRALADLGVEHRQEERLADWTSLAVGGTTDLLALRQPDRISELLRCLEEEGVPWRFLGGGSNLLVREGPLPWVVLWLSPQEARMEFSGTRVRVPAATDLGRTVTECARRGLGGMEGLIGVPGTVGGALRMNAGAYGIEIGRYVRRVEVYRPASGRAESLTAQEVGFGYRHTGLATDHIFLSTVLELEERPYEEIRRGIKVFNEKRRASQPLNEKSAGCIFKNPPGASAGKMIDELGLKGHRLGGAVVSERHANFFVNRFEATAQDFLTLIERVKEQVWRAFAVELEEEVILWS